MFALALLADPASANPVINEILADPGTVAGDANCDGAADTVADEFVEIVNTGTSSLDLSGGSINDLTGVRHTFPARTVIQPGQALVVFGGGTPTFDGTSASTDAWCLDLPNTSWQVSSTGSLALNNSGDTVSILDAAGTTLTTYVYAGEGNSDESIVRSPDLTGATLVQHTTVSNATWSPGTDLAGDEFGVTAGATLAQPSPGTAGTNNTFTITNGLPSTGYAYYWSLGAGNIPIPGCPGTSASIGFPVHFLGSRTTNANGTAALTLAIPAGAAGMTVHLQAVAISSCDITNAVIETF